MSDDKELVLTEVAVLEAEAVVRFKSKDIANEHLPSFYLRRLAEIEAARKLLWAQYQTMRAQVEAAERALVWRYGVQMKAAVDAQLGGGKRKSVDYSTGRAGYRKSQPKLVVNDETALEQWLISNGHADAVKFETKIDKRVALKAAIEAIESNGELPNGCDVIPSQDEFFPSIPGVTFDTDREAGGGALPGAVEGAAEGSGGGQGCPEHAAGL